MNKEQLAQEILEEAKKNAELLQKEAHLLIEQMMKENSHLTYQDCMNVVIFKQMGQIQAFLSAAATLINNRIKNNIGDNYSPF